MDSPRSISTRPPATRRPRSVRRTSITSSRSFRAPSRRRFVRSTRHSVRWGTAGRWAVRLPMARRSRPRPSRRASDRRIQPRPSNSRKPPRSRLPPGRPPGSWGAPARHRTAEVRARRLSARWVLPIDRPAVERGAVLIGADGRIVAAGPDTMVPRLTGVPTEDFGEALLLPGLINSHTHLELTGMAGEPPGADFAGWIRRLREAKATRSAETVLAAARRGLADCWAGGVTTVADTGDSGAVIEALADAGGSGIAYQEVFGPHPDQCDESLRELQGRVEALSRFATGRVRLGVSPHAPYTVSGPLYRATAAWAMANALPIAVHLAESPAESALLSSATG